MNTEIKIFENEQFGQIRTAVDNESGQVWFCGKDVAAVLGYKDIPQAINNRCKEWVLIPTPTNGGLQKMKFINEPNVYRLVLGSKLPEAEQFQDWVCEEVLPQIRKTGGYIPISEEDDDAVLMAKALKICQRTLAQKEELINAQKQRLSSQQQIINEQRPHVRFAQAVTSCEDSILIRDLAKLITQAGVKIGAARLFYWLRLKGYLFQRETRPIQKWVEMGLFDTDVRILNNRSGRFERLTTKVTGKGQRYFIDGFTSGRFCAENGRFQ